MRLYPIPFRAIRAKRPIANVLSKKALALTAFLGVLLCPLQAEKLLLIVGAPGEDAYRDLFQKTADRWSQLASATSIQTTRVSPDGDAVSQKKRIEEWIAAIDPNAQEVIWIVYIGHGTFNAEGVKLNLAGPDLSERELGKWLQPINAPLAFIHGGAASAPFISALSAPNRVIITATRSGTEVNFARFGEQFIQALAGERSDIDLDGKVSLLEAFVSASNAVETFYEEAGRLSTEHALIDDNGDAKGSPASLFHRLRAIPTKGGTADGRLAKRLAFGSHANDSTLTPEQEAARDRLERELEELYRKKNDLKEDDYYEQLEKALGKLAPFYLEQEDS